jgi:protein-disulfide isomerase
MLFEDFSCPACKSFNEQLLPQLEEEFIDTRQASLVFYDYIVPAGQLSWEAAIAARSVQDRAGEDAFWQYARYLYQNQSQLGWTLFQEAADELGLDGEAVVQDAQDGVYRPVVKSARKYGASLGVGGTPSVFVNGKYIRPPTAGTYADYYESIASEIRNAQ